MHLILASASPRRAELLMAAGYTFDVRPVEIDERARDGESPANYVKRLAQEKTAAALAAIDTSPPDRLRQGYGGPPKLHATAEGGHDINTGYANTGVPSRFPPPLASGTVRAPAKLAEARQREGGSRSDVVVLGADTTVIVDDRILAKPDNDDAARRMLRQLSGRGHYVLTGVSVRTSSSEASAVESTAVWFSKLTDADLDWYLSSGEGRDKAGAYAIQGLASRFIPRIDGSYSNVVGLPIATVSTLIASLHR